jgi:hypothetical protein
MGNYQSIKKELPKSDDKNSWLLINQFGDDQIHVSEEKEQENNKQFEFTLDELMNMSMTSDIYDLVNKQL